MTGVARAPVVVGVDGSPRALAAVRVAATEAALRGRPLRIVHADTPAASRPARAFLAEAKQLAHTIAPQVAATTSLIDGAPMAVLLEQCRHAALLVLGDRGLGGFIDLPIGSVAVRTAAGGTCPVLVVRGGRHDGGPVIAGVDGSPASAPALEFAAQEAALHGTELVALHAWTGDSGTGSTATPPAVCCTEDEASKILAEAVAGLPERYPGLRIRRHAEHGSARHLLTDWSHSAQLIVVGDRELAGLPPGSVGRHLIHHAACPTAVVHPALSTARRG